MVRPSMMAVAAAAALTAVLSACSSNTKAPSVADAAPVQVYAAGSLREAFTEIARQHEARTGQPVALTFGASGLLRERIEKGEPAQVFASADTDHPQRLAARGGWQPATVFTRNALCALTSEQIASKASLKVTSLYELATRAGIEDCEAFVQHFIDYERSTAR